MRSVELTGHSVRLIDQRRLPSELVIAECHTYQEVGEAIRTLAVRGAPAIGVTAAAGLSLAAYASRAEPPDRFWSALEEAAAYLRGTRPTAVNLFWAIQKMMDYANSMRGQGPERIATALLEFAQSLFEADVTVNKRMAEFGLGLIPSDAGVLTHCNTGALATVDYGTAFGVIRMAHERGKNLHVYVGETRPVLQGARLTAWECVKNGIPATLITDNMAAHFMRKGKIQICFVGADRIAANGDTANKIGTYGVAVLAREHEIPFYVVAPISTVDLAMETGDEIEIEERHHDEVTHVGGVRVAPEGIGVANPAFDVTPGKYITGIITEAGIAYPPFRLNLKRLVQGG